MPVVKACLKWNYRFYIIANMLVVASRRLLTSASSAIPFMFLDLTCFIVKNVAYSHTCMTYIVCACKRRVHLYWKTFQFGTPIYAD